MGTKKLKTVVQLRLAYKNSLNLAISSKEKKKGFTCSFSNTKNILVFTIWKIFVNYIDVFFLSWDISLANVLSRDYRIKTG